MKRRWTGGDRRVLCRDGAEEPGQISSEGTMDQLLFTGSSHSIGAESLTSVRDLRHAVDRQWLLLKRRGALKDVKECG